MFLVIILQLNDMKARRPVLFQMRVKTRAAISCVCLADDTRSDVFVLIIQRFHTFLLPIRRRVITLMLLVCSYYHKYVDVT